MKIRENKFYSIGLFFESIEYVNITKMHIPV